MSKDSIIKKEHKIKDQLLQVMIDNEWSDMYVTVWTYPWVKIWWDILRINEWIDKFDWKDAMEFAQSLITEEQHEILIESRNLDFSFFFGKRRFRWNISFQMWNYMTVLRLLTWRVPDVDALNLPSIFKDVCKVWQWLILVTWPTWSGKSTTLAAMIDFINSNYEKHIITIENPVEYVHEHKKSIMEHKELWKDVMSYNMALKWAMRQNPHVILFWEMRDREEIEMALTLAETWHLVFSTLHTKSASQTISRVIDSFPADNQNQVRLWLADSLVAVFSQRLLKTQDGTWVRMVKEILVNNSAIANLIRENDIFQIPSVMQMWSREWMQLLEADIIELVSSWKISEEEWLKYANNPKLVTEWLNEV